MEIVCMDINIDIDDEYMEALMADVKQSSDDCVRDAIGLLKWAVDMKKSGKIICLCDRNGQNLQAASLPMLDKVR
jgi:hypothetical protein